MEDFEKNSIGNSDFFLISELEKRYGIQKQAISKRLKALHIKPTKKGGNGITADQLQLMDEFQAHLKAGGKMKEFVQRCIESGKIILPEENQAALGTQEQAQALTRSQPEEMTTLDDKIETLPPGSVSPHILDEELEAIDRQAQSIGNVDYVVFSVGKSPPKCEPKRVVPTADPESTKGSWDDRFKQRWSDRLIWLSLAGISVSATVFLPVHTIALGVGVFMLGQGSDRLRRLGWTQSAGQSASQATYQAQTATTQQPETPDNSPDTQPPLEKAFPQRHYRKQERERVIATLKADSSILIVGWEGMGKTTLVKEVVRALRDQEFIVIELEQATAKNMLKEIALQLDIFTQNLEGKPYSADQLKTEIQKYLMGLPKNYKALLVIDDVHKCDPRFRDWLKILKHQGMPMFLTATDPPRKDIFLNLPRIELRPLPEYAIREIMEQKGLELGLNLKPHELASLQERAGGNPMLAQRTIEEEHLGVDAEAGDHNRYFDLTPLIMLAGVVFFVVRFMALGTNNPAVYILAGSGGAVFMSASYAMRALPKEDGKIRS